MEFLSSTTEFFVKGGFWMWPILIFHIVATAIIIERLMFLYKRKKVNQLALAQDFENLIRKGELNQAQEKAKAIAGENSLAVAIQAGIQAAKSLGGKDEIQGKMDEVLLQENAKFEERTPFLAMLANVGTLTGLLGTIIGMIQSFSAVTNASPMEKAELLSSGISVAMNTTAYGLIMAIPTLIMFAILSNRANQLSEDLNQGALKIFNWLSYAYDPVPLRVARSNRTTEVSADA